MGEVALPFVLGFFLHVFNRFIDFRKDRVPTLHAAFVSGRENMLIIILELFAADSADHVVRTGFWFRDGLRVLLLGCQLLLLLFKVFMVLLLQKLKVLLCELPFPNQLEDGGAQRRL